MGARIAAAALLVALGLGVVACDGSAEAPDEPNDALPPEETDSGDDVDDDDLEGQGGYEEFDNGAEEPDPGEAGDTEP